MKMDMGKVFLGIIALTLLDTCGLKMDTAGSSSERKNTMHHTPTGFRNYPHEPDMQASSSLGVTFYFRRFWGSLFPPELPADHVVPEKDALRRLAALKDQNTVTWLGQSAFLIRIDGKSILTDPFLTENASPLSWAGPKRHAPPGIRIKNLPPIDILLISHDHYDHLDLRTISILPNKEQIAVFVPSGLKRYFEETGYKIIHELDWNQAASIGGFTITALPTIHNSGRGLNNKNETLWCSWAVQNASANLYFAGDTAYSSTLFKDIGHKHSPFDIALLPIGAYEPRDFMVAYHVNPEEAVQIGLDINADKLVAMHWGTIDLSDEPYWEPPERFIAAARKKGMTDDRIWRMKIGETRILQTNVKY